MNMLASSSHRNHGYISITFIIPVRTDYGLVSKSPQGLSALGHEFSLVVLHYACLSDPGIGQLRSAAHLLQG